VARRFGAGSIDGAHRPNGEHQVPAERLAAQPAALKANADRQLVGIEAAKLRLPSMYGTKYGTGNP
jgi:hypothetical protein